MTLFTDDDILFKTFPKQKLTDGDIVWVTIPEYTGSENLIVFGSKVGVNSHTELYKYFSTRQLAEAYCNIVNNRKVKQDMSDRQIKIGLNTQDGIYIKIGTEAFRTTDEEGKIIRCKIGKGSNPWKYKYFSTRIAGNKYLGIDTGETKAEVKAEDLSNYNKEAILKVDITSLNTGQNWITYTNYGRKEKTIEEREKYLDSLTKINMNSSYKIKDLSDIFYWLIIRRCATSNCSSGRARTADDLYLLAKYQFKIDITFEECLKILFLVKRERAQFHPNFSLSISWCSTVTRLVTGANFPTNKTQEDFRKFFNKLKVNKNVVTNGS